MNIEMPADEAEARSHSVRQSAVCKSVMGSERPVWSYTRRRPEAAPGAGE